MGEVLGYGPLQAPFANRSQYTAQYIKQKIQCLVIILNALSPNKGIKRFRRRLNGVASGGKRKECKRF